MALLFVAKSNTLALPCVRCVREDMINPLQFIFRQAKLILFILWNLFSTSFQCSIFINVFACADAASVHYNHSFDSESWGEYFFFCCRRRLCVETKVRNKANRRRNKSHRGEIRANSFSVRFASLSLSFYLPCPRFLFLFERLWTFVHIFIFRIRDELQMCDCWKWRRRRAEERVENECRETEVDNKSTLVDLFERNRWRVSIVHVFCLAEIAMNCRSTESLTSGFIESNARTQFAIAFTAQSLFKMIRRYAIANVHLSYWILRERLIKLTASIYFAPSRTERAKKFNLFLRIYFMTHTLDIPVSECTAIMSDSRHINSFSSCKWFFHFIYLSENIIPNIFTSMLRRFSAATIDTAVVIDNNNSIWLSFM